MKVVFVLPGVQREASGGYKVVYDYANWLAEHGHGVTLLHACVLPGATPIARASACGPWCGTAPHGSDRCSCAATSCHG